MIGSRLGNWVIDRELGSGGMGAVYLAREPGGRQAAIKLLAAELSQDPGFQQRFQREIEALRQLDHPGIVHFHEAGEQDGRFYYVMEYVEGRTFEELLLEHGRLPWPEVLDMAVQVAPALKHAHDRGVIHRDLKPSNLLRTAAGVVKLTDFGIAHVFASTPLTVSGVIVGTGEYLSPEQAAGKPVTRRSDLYSLGVVLYQLLTGRPPFQGESLLDLLHKHRYAQFDSPERLVPEIPHEIAAVVCELLAKEPADRPPDGLVLQKRLESIHRRIERREEKTRELVRDRPAPDDDEPVEFEEAPLRQPGPATTMSRLMREELERQNRGGPVAQFLNRPWVLVALLVLAVGVLAWTFWPLSAEQLFQRGAKLMRSDNPEDWHTAWTNYFEPLRRKHPDHPYQEEVERFQCQIEEHEAEQKAKRTGAIGRPIGEAQWFYQQGLRLLLQGDEAGARRVWQNLVRSFQEVPSEQTWVKLAEEQLKKPAVPAKDRWGPVNAALDRARELRDEGKQVEAEAVWQALEELYRNDPSATEVLTRIREDRPKEADGRQGP